MRKIIQLSALSALFLFFAFTGFGCSGALNTLRNIQDVKFKLGSVEDFQLAGVNIARLSSPTTLSIFDAANLASAFAQGRLPASFTLNVLATNPNDGTGGKTMTSATIQSLKWRLIIDNTETVSGAINSPIEIPGSGQQTVIPVAVSLDLVQFFNAIGYERILGLAFGIGGSNGSAGNLQLKITPTISTLFGPMSLGEITAVNYEFR